MGALTKKYRLFWITETKEILNNYTVEYTGSVTDYPNTSPNTYFESDTYQDILDKISQENLIKTETPRPRA